MFVDLFIYIYTHIIVYLSIYLYVLYIAFQQDPMVCPDLPTSVRANQVDDNLDDHHDDNHDDDHDNHDDTHEGGSYFFHGGGRFISYVDPETNPNCNAVNYSIWWDILCFNVYPLPETFFLR